MSLVAVGQPAGRNPALVLEAAPTGQGLHLEPYLSPAGLGPGVRLEPFRRGPRRLPVYDRGLPKPDPQPEQIITYRIQYGDTLGGIARRYGTTIAVLAQLNGIRNPNRIYAGQVIRVPVKTSGSGQAEYYVVRPGDTLSGISSRFGTTYQRLVQLNGIRNPNLIYVGQKLRVR